MIGWRRRRQQTAPAMPVRAGYVAKEGLRQHRKRLMYLLGFGAVFYGFLYTLYGRFLLLQLLVPLIIMAALVIWLLPDTGRAPRRLIAGFFTAFLIALMAWPDYLAVAIGSLPWVTALRITTVPLAFLMLIALSTSSEFRRSIRETMDEVPLVWKLLVAFALLAFLSIFVSKDPGNSVSKFIVAQLYWTSVFFAACVVFRKPGSMITFSFLIWALVLYVCIIGVLEWRNQAVLWAGHIPNFLKIEDEAVQRILSKKARAATGIYRVQSKFTTPLGCAEFLALATPFILHHALNAKRLILRVAAVCTIPLIFHVILLTDSRLGAVGFFMSFLLYILVWALLRWKSDRESLFGPAIVLAYPVIFSGFVTATFFIGRLRAIVWGDGSQQFSDQSRKEQFMSGIPKILSTPWGNGIGQGAETLGFHNRAGVLTIDTYYLLVGLEYGVMGFFVYYGMILACIAYGWKALMKARDQEMLLLAPLTIALINFFIIKSIFSQQENHPLIFAMMGAVAAMVFRMNASRETVMEKPVAA